MDDRELAYNEMLLEARRIIKKYPPPGNAQTGRASGRDFGRAAATIAANHNISAEEGIMIGHRAMQTAERELI